MNNQPTNESSMHQPQSEKPAIADSAPTTKKSKRPLIFAAAIVGLIVLVIVLMSALFSSGDSTKQTYQDAADGSLATSGLYSDYTIAVSSRAAIAFSNSQENVSNFGSGITTISDEQIAPYEDSERVLATDIAVFEKYLDDTAAKITDKDLSAAYNEYVAVRSKLYGKDGTIKTFAEKTILSKRVLNNCEKLLSDGPKGVLFSEKYAKVNMPYVKGCIALLEKVSTSDSFTESEQSDFKIAADYYNKSATLAESMVTSGNYSTDKFTELEKTYGKELGSDSSAVNPESSDGKTQSVTMDSLSEKLDAYFDLAVSKRDKSPGSVKQNANLPEMKSSGFTKKLNDATKDVKGIEL